ncbi:MAG: hypothetical protein IJI21_10755 [Clostridia bacterium]|nr:hypothetical protein [Clostridia bacterium]
MDRELMDKEVLGILDTRQIQRFMFRSNSMVDTLGGSDLMDHILDDAIAHALRSVDPPLREGEYDLNPDPDAPIPYFEDGRVLFQQIFCTAGNAMFICRTGYLAQKLIRKVSRYYLDHGYSLNLAAAAVEKTEDFGRDIFEMYKKLNAVKMAAVISDPLGTLPVVIREKRTGEPAVARDPQTGEPISRSSQLRRQEAARRKEIIPFEALKGSAGPGGKRYRAVLHVDGNNIGITIGRLLQRTPDYLEGIRTRRRVNRHLAREYGQLVRNTLADLATYFRERNGREEDIAHHFQIIHNSGDDINCMCDADLAFPFLELFFRNLKGACIIRTEERQVPLYCCGGICFVTDGNPFHSAFRVAAECCDNAKAAAKRECNLRDGLAGNWLDFQICDRRNFQDIDLFRERDCVTDSGIDLLARPYCLDEAAKDQEFAFDALRRRVSALRRLSETHGAEWPGRIRQGCQVDRSFFMAELYRLKESGTDLEALLGKPYWRDGDGRVHALWYDAVELLPFLPEERPRPARREE